MDLLSKRVRLDFKDDPQDMSEKFLRLKNLVTVGMLEAATPANISICLYSISSLVELIGGGAGCLRPDQYVAEFPYWIAEVLLEPDAVVQTHNGGDRSTRNNKLAFMTKPFVAWNVEVYRLPVMNMISTPSFFAMDICKVKTAGMGRIRRYQSTSMPMTPVGMESCANLW